MDSLLKEVSDVLRIPDEMEKMLQAPARAYVKSAKAMFRTPADIYEHPDSYHFLLDMPGLEADKIKVKLENGILHVTGKKTKSKKGAGEASEGVKPIRVERRRAKYMRKFTLPEDANPEDVTATYKDGVLTVVVAKKPVEEQKPKKITIPIS